MSERQFTVRLTANIAQFRQAMNEAKRSSEEAGNTGIERFGALGTAATTLGRTLTTRVTVPLVGVAAGAIKTAVDFDSSMTKIQSLVGLSAAEVDAMRGAVMQLSGETARAPGELANALFFITSAGLSGSEAVSVLEMSAKAAAIGLGDTATIADLVTSAVNAYGVGVLSAAQATDDLTMAVRLGKLEPSQLAGAMGQVLPLASAMGVGFEEIAAAMAAMSRTGTNANVAATQLRGIFSQLLSPTTQAESALREVGLSVDDIHQSLRDDGLLATLELLVGSFDGNAAATEAVFGNIRALSGVVDMLGSNADGTRMIFDQMNNTVGTTDEAFDIVSDTVGFKMQEAWNALRISLLEIGNVLIPIVTRFADGVSTLFNAFNLLPDPVKELLVVAGGLAALAGPLIWMFGTLITNAIVLNKAMVALNLTLLKSPLFLVAGAAAAVGVAFGLFGRKANETTSDVEEVTEAVSEFDQKVASLTERMMNTAPVEVFNQELNKLAVSNATFGRAMAASEMSLHDLIASFDGSRDSVLDHQEALLNSVDISELTQADMEALTLTLRALSIEHETVADQMFRAALAAGATTDEAAELKAEYLELERAAKIARVEAEVWEEVSFAAAAGSEEQVDALRELERQLGFLPDAFLGTMSTAEVFEDVLNTALEEVNRAAEDLRRRVETASQGARDAFYRLSEQGKRDINTFVNELIGGSWRLAAWETSLVGIAARTSGDFALYLMEMGESGADLVSDLADPGNAAELQRAFEVWTATAGAEGTAMVDAFAEVDPGFQRVLDGVAGLTQRELQSMALVARVEASAIGRAMMQGQVQGITAQSPRVQQAIRTAVRNSINAAKLAAGISSPSRVMAEEVGAPLADGIIQGLKDSIPRLIDEMERVIEEARRTAVRSAEDMVRDVEQTTAGLWRQLDDQRRLVELEDSVAEAEKRLAEAKQEAADASKEYGRGSVEHQRALENVERETKRLEDTNYRLLKALSDAFEAGEISEAQFRATAQAAGLEAAQINNLVAQYDRLRRAKQSAADQKAAAEAEAQYMAHRLIEFEQLRAGGWFTWQEMNHLQYLRDNHSAEAAQQYLLALIYQSHAKMQADMAAAQGRLHGGPVSPGRLYEVTEDGVAELLQMGGRQFLIPGQQGEVVPLSQATNVSNVSNSATTTVTLVNNRRDLTSADVSMALSMAELAA